MRALMRKACMALVAGLAAFPAVAQQASDLIAPEAATGLTAGAPVTPPVRATRQMVVAANPLAAEAGLAMLRRGGSAADALVAVQTVLGLVEPQSSGLGGGAFLLWFDGDDRRLSSLDGRETAPGAAGADLFLAADGKPLGFFEAVVGGRSVGVPGVPRLLETIHRTDGRLPWAEVLGPAIDLADSGFKVSPRLAALIAEDAERLGREPTTRSYFFDAGGAPLSAGATLKNPAYAETLRALAAGGAEAFYAGAIAEGIVAAVRGHVGNPGQLSLDDLAAYQVKARDPVCADYRGHEVCGMGPPSSGGIAIGQILGLVAPFDLAALGPDDPQSWRIIGEATRLAFADRERYLADTDFVTMPQGLLDPAYLSMRSALIRRDTALPDDAVTAGNPPWKKAELRRDGTSPEQPSTTHIVIVDAFGNVAAMTSSIENSFGARLMVGGFLLNNQLTDFSFTPERDGAAVANRVAAGKRPRSSMAPTIVLKDGDPAFALGSPGGSQIIPYVANTLIALIDWGMDIQAAMTLPHLSNRFGTYELEAGTAAEGFASDLQALGFETAAKDMNSGLHGIAIAQGGLMGGADPRREGVAVGD